MHNCFNCPVFTKSIFYNQSSDHLNKYSQFKQIRHIEKGQTFISPGTELNGVYCIKNGNIKMIKADINGNETIVRIATAGDIIGADMLFDEYPFEKSATAINDLDVCYIDKNHFEILMKNKEIFLNLLKKTFNTLKKAEEHICSCHQKKVINRLSEFLIELIKSTGVRENDRWKIELDLNREELSMLIGTASETIIRSMAELKKLGIISGQKQIYIHNMNALEKMANNNL